MTIKATINISNVEPQLTKINDNEFLLEVDSDDVQLSLKLNALQVQTFGLTCVHHIPEMETRFSNVTEEDIYRIPVKVFNFFTDRELQTILRESQADDFQLFYWYMQDSTELMQKFINNMSQRAAEILVDDVKYLFESRHPDNAPIHQVKLARKATENIIKLVHSLQLSGEVSTL
ncbi:MAG: hypothetical protein GQ547_02100 [Methylophaga sp.]|nr:hypothetical protein [Methylophaga sp.]